MDDAPAFEIRHANLASISHVRSGALARFEPDMVPELSMHPRKRGLQRKRVFREDAPARALITPAPDHEVRADASRRPTAHGVCGLS